MSDRATGTSRRNRLRLTIVGGGVSVSTLVDLLAAQPLLRGTHLRLVGHDAARTAVVTRHLRARLDGHDSGWSVQGGTRLLELVDGADLVVLMVRVGGAAAREYDETFPSRWGLVGDEGLGPGGIANAWRTLPVLGPLAGAIRSAAPGAMVLNLIAPLGMTTRALVESGVDAVGLCELPTVTLGRLGARLGDAVRAALCVGGLNHLSWIWADASSERAARSLYDAAAEERLVDDSTWRRFGAVPMPYYFRVVEPALGARLGVCQPTGRAADLANLSGRALRGMTERPGRDLPELQARPTPWFDHALVPTVVALAGGDPWHGTANVVNRGLITGLPDEVVVEVPATVDRDGVAPRPVPAPPEPVRAFASDWAEVELRTYAAAMSRRRQDLSAAVSALPLDLPRRTGEIVDAVLAGGEVAV